jgi:hypothetical protein
MHTRASRAASRGSGDERHHLLGDQQGLDRLLAHHPAAAAALGDPDAESGKK